MCVTTYHLHYNVKGILEVCQYCATVKRNHKSIYKVAEERNLNLGKMICLDLRSQKKLSYGGSKNWILIQDSDTKQKWYFFRL